MGASKTVLVFEKYLSGIRPAPASSKDKASLSSGEAQFIRMRCELLENRFVRSCACNKIKRRGHQGTEL
jgi:hypothetical protein